MAASARTLAASLHLPAHFIHLLLAIEDKRFFYHIGIDPIALLRVGIRNVAHLSRRPHGASTITQQIYSTLARRQGTYRPDFRFKTRQILAALRLTASKSKADVLQQYLESVYFGRQIYGFRKACKEYCESAPHQLSPSEAFFIVERIARPNRVCPARVESLTARQPITAILATDVSALQRLETLYQTHFGCGEVIAKCLEKSLKKSVVPTCSYFAAASSEP